ncbi:PAS domain S-box-containing protein [Desulfotomaculum arcticum]|uniref:histidine kinase n=1 Tax=Desulfotruncus arcticus DSM 17038 TaxID=1121424 RepID=A0A1I2Q3I6_9FIRM|nr:PAS domain S-box protein [Desulfotruncus arcticus]SFG22942.1 PAS domain S-box-containing protein [Desulfotomaculum arcticum] [Desulfotruncus arcticus DSM 17038]
MKDDKKTKEQLIAEIDKLRKQVNKNAEKILAEQSRILELFFKHTLSSQAILDRNFNFIRVNEAYAKADNRDVSEFPGRNHFELYPSDALEIFNDVVRTKKPYEVFARPFVYAKNPERGVTYWDWTLVPVLDNNGEVELLFFSLKDVTKRKKAEIKLHEAETRYRLIFENSADGILMVRPDGTILTANPAVCKMLGRTEEEICRIGRDGIIDALDIGSPAGIDEIARTGKEVSELTLIKKDGTKLSCEISFGMFKGYNGNLSVIIIRDISERKKMEQEMARLDRLNIVRQMAAGIGHEIRNPMTSIRGFLQILESKPECQKYKDYYQLMIGELDRANSIISEFLSLAKNKPLKLKNQNLNKIIKALNPLITADAMNAGNNIAFELKRVPDLPLNEKEIRQLILNLVRNGLEAMSAGGTLTVKTFATDDDIVLSVQDEGKGIEPEVLDMIGTPFFTTKEQGTGLGLATCYSIAARQNATIQIETGSSGTTFLVRFKLQ